MARLETEITKLTDREVMRNPDIVTRSEIMLVKYENVLKGVDLHILEVLQSPVMKSMFGKVLDYDNMELTEEFVYDKRFSNILLDVAINPFDDQDYNRYRRGIISRYIDFYAKCKNLAFVEDLKMLLRSEKVVEKIYIIHPERDIRVIEDVKIMFDNNPKIELVFNSLENFLSEHTEITSFVTDELSDVGLCTALSNIKWLEIMIASYKNNLNDKGDLNIDYIAIMQHYICRLGTFVPFKFDKNGEEENNEDISE